MSRLVNFEVTTEEKRVKKVKKTKKREGPDGESTTIETTTTYIAGDPNVNHDAIDYRDEDKEVKEILTCVTVLCPNLCLSPSPSSVLTFLIF